MISVGGMRNFFHRFGNGCVLALLGVFAISLIINFSSNQLGNRAASGGNGKSAADTVIATVNGQPITEADFREMNAQLQNRMGGNPPAGRQFAEMQGETMQSLVQKAVITQEAKRRNARPLEADIDKAVDQYRSSVAQTMGKTKIGDQEFESYLMTNRGLSVSDLRETAAKELIPLALVNTLKADEKVTEVEARNQTAQVHLILVNVPYQDTLTPPSPTQKIKPLTEAQAKQKADALYARVKAGTDISVVAASNTDDPSGAKLKGEAGTIDEYPKNTPGQFSTSLTMFYGSDFADAIHKLTPGQTTDVIKLTGIQHGYGFAKLVERKMNTPKDFDPKKAIADLTQQRAVATLGKLIKTLVKSAKIDFTDPDKKAYYDYAKMESAQREAMQDLMSGTPGTPPSKTETEAQQAVVDKEFDDMLKRHPDDTTAAIIVAENLKKHQIEPGVSDRLLTINETIAKSTDDYDKHFELADMYRERKQYDKAKTHLDRVAKLLSYNTPYTLEDLKTADGLHRKLETQYRSINQTADADKEKALSDALQPKITAAALRQQMEDRANKKGASMPLPDMKIPAGGSSPSIKLTPTPADGNNAPLKIPAAPGGAKTPSAPAGSINAPSSPAGDANAPGPANTPDKGGASTPPAGKGQ